MKHILPKFLICIFTFLMCYIFLNSNVNATILPTSPSWATSYISDTFPADYASLIADLKAKHPNWIFKAVYTNLDWNTVISHQSNSYTSGINTIHESYSSNWKYNGRNEYADGSFVKASNAAIAYTLDPRNNITEERIFQFEYMGFSNEVHTEKAVKAVLAGTLMGEAKSSQYKVYGNKWVNLGTTYAKLILSIGKSQGISPVHMASRIRQETSCDLANNASINGQHSLYPTTYNFFNIKATPDAYGKNAVTNGLKYAKSQNWINPNNAISGGTSTIRKYINNDQNTIYFEKFPTNNEGRATKLLGTGYMTNIMAPINESKTTYNAYKNTGILDSSFVFHIPVYNNMPAICPNPNLISEYKEENTRVYLTNKTNNTYYLVNSDGNIILQIIEDKNSMLSSTPKYVIYRKRNYTFNTSDFLEVYSVETGKTYTGFMDKAYIADVPQNMLDTTPPKITVTYQQNLSENTVTVALSSNELIRDTKPTWKLSDNNLSYTKTFDKNQKYTTPVLDLSKNTTNVTIDISQIDDIPPEITFDYMLNEDNTVTVTANSNEELKPTKISWALTEDRHSYTHTFAKNQNYTTTFTDKFGNTGKYHLEFYLIKMKVDISYEYDDINNVVTAYVYNENGFKNTKPTWTLSSDKKTYSKTFNANTTYATPFTDIYDNTDMIEINISQIDNIPPEITLDYTLNEDNTVTVTANSNEEFKPTKISWTLSNNNITYTNIFKTNQDYTTTFSDKYGNIQSCNIKFDDIHIQYEITYEYDETTNSVIAKITSKTPLQNTKPTWSLNSENTTYTKKFDSNQNYTTPITDIYGNIEYVNISFDYIKEEDVINEEIY